MAALQTFDAYVSSDQLADSISDHGYAIVNEKGKIIEEGDLNQIFKSPQSQYTKDLLSSVI